MIIFPVFAGLCHSLQCCFIKKKEKKKKNHVNFLFTFSGIAKRWGREGKGNTAVGFLTG